MSVVLAIYDFETAYATRLMEYIKSNPRSPFEVILFTRAESLRDYLVAGEIELLLLGERMEDEELPKEHIKHICKLSGEKHASSECWLEGEVSGEYVYKYQSAQQLLSELIARYSRFGYTQKRERKSDVKLLSVFAPVDGIDEITYAKYLAQGLAEKRKVLLLLLEPLPISNSSEPGGREQALSELIYFLKEKPSQLSRKLLPLLGISGKLAYISGISHALDLLSLNKEDAGKLAEELNANGEFEIIVFYHGAYTEFTMELMKLSDRVHLLENGQEYSVQKLKEAERQMKLIGMSIDSGRFEKIRFPCSINISNLPTDVSENRNKQLRQIAMAQAEVI